MGVFLYSLGNLHHEYKVDGTFHLNNYTRDFNIRIMADPSIWQIKVVLLLILLTSLTEAWSLLFVRRPWLRLSGLSKFWLLRRRRRIPTAESTLRMETTF